MNPMDIPLTIVFLLLFISVVMTIFGEKPDRIKFGIATVFLLTLFCMMAIKYNQ